MKPAKLVLLVLFFLVCNLSVNAALADDVVGSFHFEEVVNPYINELTTGNFVFVGSPPQTVPGKSNNGTWVGKDNNNHIQWNISGNRDASYSLSFWYNHTSAEAGSFAFWDTFGSWGGAYLDFYTVMVDGNQIYTWIDTNCDNNYKQSTYPAGTFKDNVGYEMYTFVWDATTDNVTIYMNDTVIVNDALGGNPCTAIDHLAFSRINAAVYTTTMDELTLWNGSLSQSDVTDLYNSGVGLFYPFPLGFPVITNSSWNFTSARYEVNRTAWRTNQSYPIPTFDSTPTVRFNTSGNAYCRIHTEDQNWTTMGNARNCSSTGTTGHVCTLPAADQLIIPGFDQLYIGCIDATFTYEQDNSTSSALWIDYQVQTNLTAGLVVDDVVLTQNIVSEGDDFKIYGLWTYSNGTFIGDSLGVCAFSAIDIIKEYYNTTLGLNTTVCTAGCTYNNRSEVYDLKETDVSEDLFRLQLCHNGAFEHPFITAVNCSGGVTQVWPAGTIPNCNSGYLDFDWNLTSCVDDDRVEFSVWSEGANTNSALRLVDDFIGVDRVHNDSAGEMSYNGSLWLGDEHEYYEHGNKSIGVNCTSSLGFENATAYFNMTVENEPPQIFVDRIWDWINGYQTFNSGVVGKYPLGNGSVDTDNINITGGCFDDDLDSAVVNLSYTSNGSIIHSQTFKAANNTLPALVNYSYLLFSTNRSFLDGTYSYTFYAACNDTGGNTSTITRTFTAQNDPPVGVWGDGSEVSINSVPYNLSFSCSDVEGEDLTSYVYVNGLLNDSVSPTQGWFLFNASDEGSYGLNLSCGDSFYNSTNVTLSLTYFDSCIIQYYGVEDGDRFSDNEFLMSVNCSNDINLTACEYSINDFKEVGVNCSDNNEFLVVAERGWNTFNLTVNPGMVSSNSLEVTFWAKDADASIFDYPVLWVMLFVMVAFFVLGMRYGVFYVLGGLAGAVVGYQLIAFSVVLGVSFSVVVVVAGLALLFSKSSYAV